MMFLKLGRIKGHWLPEDLDLKSNELMDFIFDGMGWGCHHGLHSDDEGAASSVGPNANRKIARKTKLSCRPPLPEM